MLAVLPVDEDDTSAATPAPGMTKRPAAAVIGQPAAVVDSLELALDAIAVDAELPAGAEAPPLLSAAENIQRVEATASAVEWLLLGGLAYWLAHVVGVWLAFKIGAGWWSVLLPFGLQAIALVPVALYVGGLAKLRVYLALAGAYLLLAIGISFAFPVAVGAAIAFLLYVFYIGSIAAPIFKMPLWRGACTAFGGPLAAGLIASPIIIGFFLLAGLIHSEFTFSAVEKTASLAQARGDKTAHSEFAFPTVEKERAGISLVAGAAFLWCALVVFGSTASETVVKHVVTNLPVIRGIGALALAFVTAAVTFFLVAVCTKLLTEKSVPIMQWVIFFAFSQLAPPLLRWQWRLTFSLFSAAVSLAMIGAVLVMEWLSPYSSSLIVSWVAACTALVLLNVKTVDILANKAEVLTRLQTRMRSRRLPVRIEVRRR